MIVRKYDALVIFSSNFLLHWQWRNYSSSNIWLKIWLGLFFLTWPLIDQIHCGCFLQINFVLTSAYTSMVDQMGFHGTFWLYASFSAVSAVFIAICVPETRNKTDEQIAKFFEWKSCCYKSQSCESQQNEQLEDEPRGWVQGFCTNSNEKFVKTMLQPRQTDL